jgi:hypothetical protein
MSNERKQVLKKLRRQKVMTLDEIAAALVCSPRSVQRRFSKWRMIKSFNQNSKYYTLPEIPKFNEYGLWYYEGIGFSQHGNLKETLIYLVAQSKAGIVAGELENLLGLASNSPVVYQMRNDGLLKMEKAFGRVTLFSANHARFQFQLHERERIGSTPLPGCEESVLILVEMIKNPEISPAQISHRLNKSGHSVNETGIRKFLEYHGLVKKTLDMI